MDIEQEEAKFDLIMRYLRWMKTKHGGEMWTPDSWAGLMGSPGMSPDSTGTGPRIHEFLREEQAHHGDADG